jgi:hypothetical protein
MRRIGVMKQHRRSSTLCMLAALALGTVLAGAVRGQEFVGETWRDKKEQIIAFIDAAISTGAAEGLPPAVGDIVNLLRASPDIAKQALREVLKRKMTDAIMDDDWDRVDRIQAFSSCLEGDCGRLEQLQATWRPSDPPAETSDDLGGAETPAATTAAPQCCLGDGDGPWFCCQWMHPTLRTQTCAPSKNRPLCASYEQGKAVDNAICTEVQPGMAGCKPM